MDNEVMTNEENYAFDVAGYLHVPGVLSQEEVAALNAALDAVEDNETLLGGDSSHRELFRALLVHPTLVWYLNQMIGHGFRLDQALACWGSKTVKSVQHSSVAMNREIHLWHIVYKTVSGVVRA